MKKNYLFLTLVFYVLSVSIIYSQQNNGIQFRLTPGAVVPVGSSNGRYGLGFSADLECDYYMPFAPVVFASGGIGFEQSTNTITDSGLLLFSAGAGGGVNVSPVNRLNLRASGSGGYYLGMYENETGGSVFFKAGANLSFKFNPSFSLGVSGAYRHYFTGTEPFFQGVQTSLEVSINPSGAKKKSRIEYMDIHFEQVFPVFHAYYSKHPVGTVVIKNGENAPIENVTVSFFAEEYMANPTVSANFDRIPMNREQTIPLFALFGKNILELTEGTEASAEIIIEYVVSGTDILTSKSCVLPIERRNAMTWVDDNRAASFVTANDPAVLRFSKPIAAAVREQSAASLNANFRYAFAVFQGLSEYGMGYVVDPATPYQDLSENRYSVDFLQFPNETLTYRSGDCDDLSIMYAALLQSINIDTAFVTVPGHIFIAFSLDIPPEEGRKMFSNPDNLIFMNDNTWVPVEITMFGDDFIKAWHYAAREWRADAPENAGFFPVREAWNIYRPVDSPFNDADIDFPDTGDVLLSYEKHLEAFIRNDIEGRKEALEKKISQSNNSPRQVNRLGVLYARYGLIDDAVENFQLAAAEDYAPAIINLGNIFLLKEEYAEAAVFFERADRLFPENPNVVLGLARVNYELEDYSEVKIRYEKLAELDPLLAEEYSYLTTASESTSRAGFNEERRAPLWSEE